MGELARSLLRSYPERTHPRVTRDAQLVKMQEGKLAKQMSEADFDLVVGINLKGVFNCTQAVAPFMIQQGGGSSSTLRRWWACMATWARPITWPPRRA